MPTRQPAHRRHCWALRPTADRAGCLLIGGEPFLITELWDGPDWLGVRLTQAGGRVLDLYCQAGRWTCECCDFRFRGRACAHTAAIAKALRKRSEP